MSVIEFPKKPAAGAVWTDCESVRAFRETPRQRAGRRRNPLREPAERVSLAVTIAGKLANGRADELKRWAWGGVDYVAMLRRGADAARLLADELDRVTNETPVPPIA